METACDILVVGGGINGCGVARDAAGRGFSVVLCEMGDLGGATSSWSTKLIHGGLRYLEHGEFRLVREALREREVLWRAAPHIIRPMRFVLPHHEGLRPAWMLRLGLFVYDHLGGRERLLPTRTLDLRHDPAGAPLRPGFARAFEYSDCQVDDSRLVILNARAARDLGATILTRTRVAGLVREGDRWRARLETPAGRREIVARLVVDATGPWVGRVPGIGGREREAAPIRLVRGSHIVVPRLNADERAYVFQNGDGRVVFAIPFEDDFTLIGTTDCDHHGDPGEVAITPEEAAYLCESVSAYLASPVTPADVVWSFSGVRPLVDDGASAAQEATRDYVLRLGPEEGAGLVTILGGKITTYRRLAEAVMEKIEAMLGRRGPAWTAGATLPGGDFPPDGLDALTQELAATPGLPPGLAGRLARTYGTDAGRILRGTGSAADLGRHFGAGLYEREVRFLRDEEWAETADDVLWRRTKLGLRLTPAQAAGVAAYLDGTAIGGMTEAEEAT